MVDSETEVSHAQPLSTLGLLQRQKCLGCKRDTVCFLAQALLHRDPECVS